MTDVFTRKKRSQVMSAIRSKGNRTTEWKLRARMISAGISGWNINPKDVVGKPDFVFVENKIAIFVDGCFWHGCRKCRNLPNTNRKFWSNKIGGNIKRDRKINRILTKNGWVVLRFWEHALKKQPNSCISIIKNDLKHVNGE